MRAVVPRRWRGRIVGALLLYAALEVVLSLTDYAPDPLRSDSRVHLDKL